MKEIKKLIIALPILAALILSVSVTAQEGQAESKPVVTNQIKPVILVTNIPKQPKSLAPLPLAPNQAEVEMLARLIWGEARSVPTREEKAAVVWCVLNRVDDPRWPDTVSEVVLQEGQFYGYSPDCPVTRENEEIAFEVLRDWLSGDESNRVLPREYVFFTGDGTHNWFRSEY